MDVAATDQRGRLSRNLAALRLVNPGLAERLSSLPDDQVIELAECQREGLLTGRAVCDDGQEVWLASRFEPDVEAARWVDSLADIDEGTHSVVVVGCGLGYHVAELLKRRRGGLLVVLEPSLPILHAALRCHEFFQDILTGRLVFLVVGARSELFEPLHGHNVELMLGSRLAQHPVSSRLAGQACAELHRMFTDYLQFAHSGVATMVQISAVSTANVLENLPFYLAWPSVSQLKDICKGRPGICVAAGPSLRKNMHLLAQAKGRAPIIAVQTVLRTLLGAGIRPDYITALDYSPLSRRFYESLGDVSDITLVADPKVNPVVPNSYGGPIRMFANEFATRVLDGMDVGHDRLQAGSTVAHLNFYLARYMGCDPIILIGQDLGFGENIYYLPGTPIQTAWSAELNRFNSMEMMEWQHIVRYRGAMRKARSQAGGEMYSTVQMFTYLQQFERDIAATEARVINATEGGAVIEGTQAMPLAEALERFAQGPMDPLPIARPVAEGAALAGDARRRLRRQLARLDRMEQVCDRVLGPLREMTEALDDPDRFNRLHARMNTWRLKIDQLKGTYRLVADVMQLAELKRIQMDKARERKDMDEIAVRRDQLARDIQYVTLLRQGVKTLRRNIQTARRRLEEVR